MAQKVKKLPAMQETQVQSLGQEDPLELDMTEQLALKTQKNYKIIKIINYKYYHISVQFSHSVMSNSLQPHGL